MWKSGSLLLFQEATVEGEGEELADTFNYVRALRAEEEDAHGASGARLRLQHHLPAGAARRGGDGRQPVGIRSGYCQRHDAVLGVLCSGSKQSRALGAEALGKRGILLIAACHNRAVVQTKGSAHMEMAIRGITAPCGLLGSKHQLSIRLRKLVESIQRVTTLVGELFHVFSWIFCKNKATVA